MGGAIQIVQTQPSGDWDSFRVQGDDDADYSHCDGDDDIDGDGDDQWLPGCDWDGSEVQVVPNCVLQVVVNPALGEPCVQVLPQVGSYRTWKKEKAIRNMLLKVIILHHTVSYVGWQGIIDCYQFSYIFWSL